MADWLWVESPGSAERDEPSVQAVRFGDGYEQAAYDGIAPHLRTWDLVFTDVDNAVAADMVAFLKEHGAVAGFSYVPLWETTAVQVVCRRWSRTLGSVLGTSTINATFEQRVVPA